MPTSDFTSAVISSLNVHLAPRVTRHGVLVEVYGSGLLILGDSGIGKSETAIELIKRGHRLIADDAVEISRVSEKTLVGKAPEIIKYYMELRGIGIIDVRRLFGMGAVKATEKIELVIKLEKWIEGKAYDRMGLDNEYHEILGINVPAITIPVHPGRNLAVILEIAAMNFRLKKSGYNTAEEFNKQLEQALNLPTDKQ
jgi:HPr kinase/phosphorylase